MKRFLTAIVVTALMGGVVQECAAGCGGYSGGYGYSSVGPVYSGGYGYHYSRPAYSSSYGYYAQPSYSTRPARPLAEPVLTQPEVRPSLGRPTIGSQPVPGVRPPLVRNPGLGGRPTLGGVRPSGPSIIEPGQLSGGTQLKFENGQLKAFDSNGRFLGIVRQGR